MSTTPAVDLEGVSFSYGGPSVLEGIDLRVEAGEFLGVVGPNAGGKSTLLKLMLGLLHPDGGRVRLLGRRAEAARQRAGYVPQYPAFARDFPITVEQTVLMGRLGRTPLLGGWRRADRTVARRVMAETEISSVARRRLDTLSGGQLQRVLLARALACEPEVLMLDEPTANIDMRLETDIFDLLKDLNRRMTIIVVSHDVAFVSRYVGRVACVNRTLMCHSTAAIDGEIIQDLYRGDVHMVEHRHP
ncbi:MAG: ABC transporter ATP-binding protein [Chromatiales bacterium]